MNVIRQQLRSLGALLLERGLIRQSELDLALAEQKASGEKLGRILIQRGLVSESDIVSVLEGIMVVVFSLGEDEFAMPSLEVREIIRHRPALPLPGAPAYFEGIINYRQKVVPVLHLGRRFQRPAAAPDEATRIIVYEHGNRVYGLQVDAVSSVTQVRGEDLDMSARSLAGIPGRWLAGMARLGERSVAVLKVEELLQGEEGLADAAAQAAEPGA